MLYGHKLFLAGSLGLALIIGAVGCGGTQTTPASIFTGDYAGSWLYGTTGANGPATITITTDSQFYGNFRDLVSNTDNAISAVIKNSGDVHGTFTPDGGSPIIISGTLILSGGHFAGTLDETSGGNQIGQLQVDIVKQP